GCSRVLLVRSRSSWPTPSTSSIRSGQAHSQANSANRRPLSANPGPRLESAAKILAASEMRTTLGRYRILGEIGKGGMGVVYRAADSRLGREVALKVLAPGPGDDPDRERRLRREAQAAAALAHPAICVIYEIDEADGATFIAMELVRGFPPGARRQARVPP